MINTFPFPKRRRGYARVEYQAVEKEISNLEAKNYPPIMIYDELKAQGKITMSLNRFRSLLKTRKTSSSVSSDRPLNPSVPAQSLGETA